MNDRINKTSICSIVFLDIIDYTKTPVSEQIEVKNQFNAFINHALKDVAQNDRIILDTGDGAAIAYMGSPEDALFMALSIRDGILKNNASSVKPMLVRIGINLGPVRVVKDINGQPNIIGDGINVAQRIMSFAQPNQVLVSRSYYEVTSRLTQEMSKMFDYSGVKHDKHVREHEVYSVKLDNAQTQTSEQAAILTEDRAESAAPLMSLAKINWKYAASGLAIVTAVLALTQLVSAPASPVVNIAATPLAATLSQASVKEASKDKPQAQEKAPATIAVEEKLEKNNLAPDQPAQGQLAQDKKAQNQLADDKLAKTRLAKKKAKQLAKQKAQAESKPELKSEPAPVATPTHKEVAHTSTTSTHTSKPAPETISQKIEAISTKSVLQHECTQAEKMMNTCH